MINTVLTPSTNQPPANGRSIYCPALKGLSGRRADLAIVMPRIDNNRALLAVPPRKNDTFAGVLTSDPFGAGGTFLDRLSEHGYVGVANWPSSILFEGQTKLSMSSIPATPQQEYAWLANAQTQRMQTLAFFRSLEQGREALKAGLRNLILHPGFISESNVGSVEMLTAALVGLVKNLRSDAPDTTVSLYEHEALNGQITAHDVGAQGIVTYGEEI